MVESDTPTYHVKKPFADQKSMVFHSLITEERTQKLELLIHLITNTNQALVVCGPQGVGKSTLLKVLQERDVESRVYCFVQGNKALSIDTIQEQMIQVIKHDKPGNRVQTLSDVFRLVEGHHKKIILMIDDAGHLAPGLINTIIDYVAKHPVIRVIFVLTHDDLYIKNNSDSAVDDCYLIEIPPLSELQCGEFLQYLATKPRSSVTFNDINEVMIASVYHETDGIPGKIIAKLPGFEGAKKSDNSLGILVFSVAGLVALALGIQWYSGSKYNIKPTPNSATEVQKSADNKSSLPLPPLLSLSQQNEHPGQADAPILNQHAEEDGIGSLTEAGTNTIFKSIAETNGQLLIDRQQLNDAKKTKPADSKTDNAVELSMHNTIIPQQTEPIAEEQAQVSVDQNDGEQWLKTQPIDNYTLQVMMLSKEQSIKDVIRKYPQHGQNLRYIKSIAAKGKTRFVLLYGSFTSASLAIQSKKSLPPEFRNSIAVKLSAIKK